MKHSARHTKKKKKLLLLLLCRAEIVSGGRPRPAPPTIATTLYKYIHILYALVMGVSGPWSIHGPLVQMYKNVGVQ